MKFVKQSYEIIPQENSLVGMYKHIEKAGRICYKSEDRITEDSYDRFIKGLIKSGHTSVLEHGTIYLKMNRYNGACIYKAEKYKQNPYSKLNVEANYYYITTNYRVIIENKWEDDLQFMCEPTEYHEKRVTVQFVTNQGILREFTRHRKFSFSVESTRYCNYSKNKYEREITFIEPWFINDDRELLSSEAFDNVYEVLCSTYEEAEGYYMLLLDEGFKPEEARGVLPLDTKCEMIMTGFVSDWKHFFNLRALGTTGAPHPQAKELAEPLMQEFKALNYIE